MMRQLASTRYKKLPFQFEEALLLNDLDKVVKKAWVPHKNIWAYDGDWQSTALYTVDGTSEGLDVSINDHQQVTPAPIIRECPYFEKVIDQFKCAFLSVRLLNLSAGAYIKPHRDDKAGYKDGNFRIHIPISTNDDVHFILDDSRIKMRPGECWYTNVNYLHSVYNKGTTARVHLIIDGVRNDWSDELFFSLAPQESYFTSQEHERSEEVLRRTIEELKRQDTPKARELILAMQPPEKPPSIQR